MTASHVKSTRSTPPAATRSTASRRWRRTADGGVGRRKNSMSSAVFSDPRQEHVGSSVRWRGVSVPAASGASVAAAGLGACWPRGPWGRPGEASGEEKTRPAGSLSTDGPAHELGQAPGDEPGPARAAVLAVSRSRPGEALEIEPQALRGDAMPGPRPGSAARARRPGRGSLEAHVAGSVNLMALRGG